MKDTIVKIGGSSLSSARNVSNAANIIVEHYLGNISSGLNVVISAFGVEPGGRKEDKVTDRLISVADYTVQGNINGALGEIERVKTIYYTITDALKLERAIVDGNFKSLEELVLSSIRDLEGGASLNRKKMIDAIATFGELTSTPVVAEVVQKKLETRFQAVNYCGLKHHSV